MSLASCIVVQETHPDVVPNSACDDLVLTVNLVNLHLLVAKVEVSSKPSPGWPCNSHTAYLREVNTGRPFFTLHMAFKVDLDLEQQTQIDMKTSAGLGWSCCLLQCSGRRVNALLCVHGRGQLLIFMVNVNHTQNRFCPQVCLNIAEKFWSI